MAINPKSFGSIGDGVADDTAALQASINFAYAQNDFVYIDGGVYFVNASFYFPL